MQFSQETFAELQNLVQVYGAKGDHELELRFQGIQRHVFDRILLKCKSQGFRALPCEDYIHITVGDVRMKLSSPADICKYYETNDVRDFPHGEFSRKGRVVQIVRVPEWDLVAQAKPEVRISWDEIPETTRRGWIRMHKYYRQIKRYSFITKDGLFRVDCSAVRQPPFQKSAPGERFVGQYVRIQDAGLAKAVERYEIELEYLGGDDANAEEDTKKMVKYIMVLQQAIQDSFFVIPRSVVAHVLDTYKKLTGNTYFVGPQPKSIQHEHLNPAQSLLDFARDYCVTEKADGERMLLFVMDEGDLFAIDRNMNVRSLGVRVADTRFHGGSLFDAEYITRTKTGKAIKYLKLFDCYYIGGYDVRHYPLFQPPNANRKLFVEKTSEGPVLVYDKSAIDTSESESKQKISSRYSWIEKFPYEGLEIVKGGESVRRFCVEILPKRHLLPSVDTPFHVVCKELLAAEFVYHTDGLIFTPAFLPVGIVPHARMPEPQTQKGGRSRRVLRFGGANTADAEVEELASEAEAEATEESASESDTEATPPSTDERNQIDEDKGYEEIRKQVAMSSNRGTWELLLKWKPPQENTIDFFVNIVKQDDHPKLFYVVDPHTGVESQAICLHLFVLGDRVDGDDLLEGMLRQQHTEKLTTNRPIRFRPSTLEDESYCYVAVDEVSGTAYTGNKEMLMDRSIVEMSYDTTMPEGWRWSPMRLRNDKTEMLQRNKLRGLPNPYTGTMNHKTVAFSVYETIRNPIFAEMLTSPPSEMDTSAVDAYYVRTTERANMLMRPMYDFHGRIIREFVLYRRLICRTGAKTMMDLGVGQGGDLLRIHRSSERARALESPEPGITFLFGVEKYYNGLYGNLSNKSAGCIQRFLDMRAKNRQVFEGLFVVGDCSKSLLNMQAYHNPRVDGAIAGAILKGLPANPTDEQKRVQSAKVVQKYAGLGTFDITSCQFAIHYFWESDDLRATFLDNIMKHTHTTGYFIATCFDGRTLANRLRDVPTGGFIEQRHDGKLLWRITKRYTEESAVETSESGHLPTGLAIDVFLESIGTVQREYLVDFDGLVEQMRGRGFELLTPPECELLDLPASTGMFGDMWKYMDTTPVEDILRGNGNEFDRTEIVHYKNLVHDMKDAEKELSFMYRWFVFHRLDDA